VVVVVAGTLGNVAVAVTSLVATIGVDEVVKEPSPRALGVDTCLTMLLGRKVSTITAGVAGLEVATLSPLVAISLCSTGVATLDVAKRLSPSMSNLLRFDSGSDVKLDLQLLLSLLNGQLLSSMEHVLGHLSAIVGHHRKL
jgi:hypothetical protein